MKKQYTLLAVLFCLSVSFDCLSQTRYQSEIFTSVNTTTNVTYGNNISVLTGTPASIPLLMDVYEPAGDVLTARPLIIILHAGSFLPAIANRLAVGKKTDSAIVNTCMRFAKRGYVAVAMDYRLGWNPLGDQDTRTGTILNAVYRALQDAKNCVRFFRNDAATTNTFKIDVNRICVGGMSAGGYVALAYGSLNKPAEIQLTKFADLDTGTPYVDQSVSGNFDGTDATPLNTPNYASYSSSVNVVFSLAGCVGDTSWIEPGEIPIISMHCYKDPFAPYTTGPVIVAATGQFVVEASGGRDVIRRSQRLGNQTVIKNAIINDVYTTKANANSPGLAGLYTHITPAPGANLSCTGANANAQTEQSAPWDWWNEPTFIGTYNAYCGCTDGTAINCMNKRENPDMSGTKGKAYLDTIVGFLNPRIICALNLPGCVSVGLNELSNNVDLSIYPNPGTSEINYVVADEQEIKNITIYDVTGRVVSEITGLSTHSYKLNCEQLKPGLYYTTISTNGNNTATKKIFIE